MLKFVLSFFIFSWSRADIYIFDKDLQVCRSLEEKNKIGLNSSNLGICMDGAGKNYSNLSVQMLDLSGAHLNQARIMDANIGQLVGKKVKFKQAYISKSSVLYSRISKSDFRGAQLQNVMFKNFSFLESDFSGAKISNTLFLGGDFKKVQFHNALITDSKFEDCVLPSSIKEEAILINVKIKNCRFE